MRSQFDALQANDPVLPLPTVAANEFGGLIREYEARQVKLDIPPELELEPLPEFIEPAPVDRAAVLAQMDSALIFQFMMLPLGVIMRLIFLVVALAANNRVQTSERDKIKLPGNYLGISLVAFAWFSLEYALGYVVGFAIGYLMGSGFVVQLTVYLAAMLISLILIFGLLVLATRRSFDEVSKVALGAFTMVALTSLRSLRGLI